MARKKQAKEGVKPLLYIAQPELEEAKLNVQHSYVVKVNKQDQKAAEKEYVPQNNLDEIEEEYEEASEPIQEVSSGRVKKPFKSMTNEEKVYFMINKPHYIPKVECRIRTKNDLFIGYIVAYNKGLVSVKVSSSINNIEIPISEIDNIQMVGI
jgi:Spore coat protein CotO